MTAMQRLKVELEARRLNDGDVGATVFFTEQSSEACKKVLKRIHSTKRPSQGHCDNNWCAKVDYCLLLSRLSDTTIKKKTEE